MREPRKLKGGPAACVVRAAPFAALAAIVGTLRALVSFLLVDQRHKKTLYGVDVTKTLLFFCNQCVDPCSEFAGYACYHREACRKWVMSNNAVNLSVVYPTLQGRLRTTATEAWRGHHKYGRP
ncbi:hypothetical protein MRX96_000255 [Rhipicephalus microplus]